jgi:hypothetical protein
MGAPAGSLLTSLSLSLSPLLTTRSLDGFRNCYRSESFRSAIPSSHCSVRISVLYASIAMFNL